MTPGAVGRPDPAREPARLAPDAGGADDPGAGGSVLRVYELGQPSALELCGRLAVRADGRARILDDPAAIPHHPHSPLPVTYPTPPILPALPHPPPPPPS